MESKSNANVPYIVFEGECARQAGFGLPAFLGGAKYRLKSATL